MCIVGNLLGRNPGNVTTQGQIIADLFLETDHAIISVSSKKGRFHRLADVIWTIFRNRKNIDVLMIEIYSGLGFLLADAASLVGKIFGIPSVFVLHGGNLPAFGKRYPQWFRRVLDRAEALVAPSTFLAGKIQRSGLEVRVIPNVINVSTYPFRTRRNISPKLFWMRSFHPIYNPQMALKAFELVKQKNPDATLVMAGVDKGLESSIKDLSRDLGLSDSMHFPGFLDDRSKIREFSEADIYLNTNRIDNMPVSIVEACAAGLPVVATDVGGVSHLITNELNGLLVADNDPQEMASTIERLLADPDLTERLSRNGRLLAERSDWNNVRDAWEDLFADVLKTKYQTDHTAVTAAG